MLTENKPLEKYKDNLIKKRSLLNSVRIKKNDLVDTNQNHKQTLGLKQAQVKQQQ